MNAQVTVRARRVNTNTKPLGEHCTLTKVCNDNVSGKFFGFAMTDTGEEIYIPASLVRNQQMTEHDVGAGFTVVLKNNTGFEAGHGRVAVPPLKWDGEAEEVSVYVPPEQPAVSQEDIEDLEKDIVTLANGAEDIVIQTSTNISAAIADLKGLDIKGAMTRLENAVKQVEAFRSVINDIAPDYTDEE